MQGHGFLSTLSVSTDSSLSNNEQILTSVWKTLNHQSHFSHLLYVFVLFFLGAPHVSLLDQALVSIRLVYIHCHILGNSFFSTRSSAAHRNDTMPYSGATVQLLILNMEPVVASILLSIAFSRWDHYLHFIHYVAATYGCSNGSTAGR